jgi:glycosyltransferase involved in cell wall biosynthesis
MSKKADGLKKGTKLYANEKPIEVSIIVACYNEQAVLRDSVARLVEVMGVTRYADCYELIFVDDVSKDNTVNLVIELMDRYGNVPMKLIQHAQNKGRGRTVMDGFGIARGRLMGFLDIDLETPAHYIPVALLELERGADVVTALRIYKFMWWSLHRQILSKGYHRLVSAALRVPLQDTEVGFKFFRRDTALKIVEECTDPGWFWDTEVMTRAYFAGLQIVEIPTLFIKRSDKKSTVRPVHDTLVYFRKLRKFRQEANHLENDYRARGLTPREVNTLSHPVGHADDAAHVIVTSANR